MGFLLDECRFSPLNREIINECAPFECGNADLNEFFRKDAPSYSQQLLGKSYCFRLDKNLSIIVCAFTVSNDSIRVDILPNSREKKVRKDIPRTKQMRRYPAVLIGRLGINADFARRGIGSELMDFIKAWFIDEGNKTGCRFVIVDAYNEEKTLGYYKKNGFIPLFSSESQEAQNTGFDKDTKLRTRLMYYDLISLSTKHRNNP